MIALRAGAAQIDAALCDPGANLRTALAAVTEAAERGAQLVVLPELVNSGYPDAVEPELMLRFFACAETVPGPFTEALSALAAERGVHIVAGLLERHPLVAGGMWNAAAVISPDGTVAVQRKLHLPRDEKRYFMAGERLEPFATTLGRIGVLVCADNSFPEAMRLLALRGAEVICVPYAARRTANADTYRWMAATRAYENQVFVIGANRVGGEFGGRSTIAAPDGAVLATLDGDPGIAVADLDPELLLAERLRQTRFRDRRPGLYAQLAAVDG